MQDKGKGSRAPSNLAVGLDDAFVPDFEASLEYEELETLRGESDHDGDTDSDASNEDDQERDITLPGDRKFPYRRTSSAAVGCFDDLEVEEAIQFDATIRASIRYPVNGRAWTSAGSTGHIRAALAPAAAVQHFVMEHEFEVDSDVDPDCDFGGEAMMLTDSKDEPMVQRITGHGTDRCRDNRQPTRAYDVGSTHRSSCSEGRGDNRPDRLDKLKRTMLEDELDRQVTHVGQVASFPVPRFVFKDLIVYALFTITIGSAVISPRSNLVKP